jgi:hypothetical protein
MAITALAPPHVVRVRPPPSPSLSVPKEELEQTHVCENRREARGTEVYSRGGGRGYGQAGY